MTLFLLSYRVQSKPIRSPRETTFSILMVVPQFDRIGGYEIQAAQISSSLAGNGHLITVLTDQTDNLSPREFRNGFLIRRIAGSKMKIGLSLLFFLMRHRRYYNMAHVHGVSGFSLFAARVCSLLRIPVLLKPATKGDVASIVLSSGFKKKIYARWLRKPSAFIAVSEELKREIESAEIPESRIRMIPNFVNTEKFKKCDVARRQQLRNKMNLNNGQTVFLYVGRLEKRKGVEFLLRAWQNTGVLWIVGSGPEESSLRKLSEDLKLTNVHFYGACNPLEFYQAADIFVFPSLQEGAPNVLLEAMSCSLPVITTRIGGVMDQVQHKRQGLLVSPASIEELTLAMNYAQLNPKEREKWGKNAEETVRQQFDISRITSLYLALYSDLSTAAI